MISVGFHFRKCGCKSKALTKESLTDFSLEFVTICIDYIGEALSRSGRGSFTGSWSRLSDGQDKNCECFLENRRKISAMESDFRNVSDYKLFKIAPPPTRHVFLEILEWVFKYCNCFHQIYRNRLQCVRQFWRRKRVRSIVSD